MLIVLKFYIFAHAKTVIVAQLVRASDCGSEGRGFRPIIHPKSIQILDAFYFMDVLEILRFGDAVQNQSYRIIIQ